MNKTIYGTITKSKNNQDVSLFINSKPVFSIYNPNNEAENFCKINANTEKNFFVTTGMAQAYHIFALQKNFPGSKILILEKYTDDFYKNEFSKTYETLKSNPNIIFSTVDTLEQDLINNYLPATDGDFIYRSLRSWIAQNNELEKLINIKINNALCIIKDDYSVQSHFGKLWFVNFCKNLNLLKKYPDIITSFSNHNFPKDKVAAIVSAGPTLDYTIEKIRKNREIYYVISTDTAYQCLIKNNIIPDVFVTIDAQQVSSLHAINNFNKDTLIVADLTSNNSIVNKAVKQNCKIIFSCNSNPFCTFALNYFNKKLNNNLFIKLNSGTGTVTMSALDFAYHCGFLNIEFFGTDFSYQNGKPYCKGTYLDRIYFSEANKNFNSETKFCKLMYRTELQPLTDKMLTSHILNSYKNSFINFIKKYKNLIIYSANGKIQNENFPAYKIDNLQQFESENKKAITKNINFDNNCFNDFWKSFKIEIDNNVLLIYPLICNIKKNNINNAINISKNIAKKIIANYN
jgi:hypothetical protein